MFKVRHTMDEKNVSDLPKIHEEYVYKGVVYGIGVPRDLLSEIEEFTFRHDDIILAVYPKCGRFLIIFSGILLLACKIKSNRQGAFPF